MNDIRQVKVQNRFIYIILAIILMMLVGPFIGHTGKSGHFLDTILAAMIPLSCFYALTADRNRAIIILFIAAPFLILDGINIGFLRRTISESKRQGKSYLYKLTGTPIYRPIRMTVPIN